MHGVWFDGLHSYADLNLVLSKVEFPPAKPKTNFVDIPGADGSVDQTETLGEVRFQDRKPVFTFTVMPTDDYEEKKREVSNLLNGQRKKIALDKDPGYYWTGRCEIDKYSSNKKIRQIVVSATVAPYKLKEHVTKVTIPAGTAVVKTLRNSRKSAVPIIMCTADTTVIFKGDTFQFGTGTHKNLSIKLVEGDNQVTVTSTGTVEFTYQEGDL